MSFGFRNDFSYSNEEEIEIQEPGLYNVIMHNDDYTTMEFVIFILMEVYNKSDDEAKNIMINIHTKGSGVAGTYVYDIAKTKLDQTNKLSEKNTYPLLCTIEEEK